MEQVKITPEESGERLDKYLADNVDGLSRTYAARLCDEGMVYLEGGGAVSKKYKVKAGEEITVDIPDPEELSAEPEDIPLDIVYEDESVIVINKPRGMVVHPAVGSPSGTLVNALLYHCRGELSGINGVLRPGIVHRIDKDTTGLLLAAKTDTAHMCFSAQLKLRKPLRRYWALVNGELKEETGLINKPIGRNPKDRKKMAVVRGGKEAVTHYRVLERFLGYTLVECVLETGRTHQIRVHMASIGHSLVGDPLYGQKNGRFPLTGQLLHAKTLGFEHPVTGELMEFDSEIPEDFQNVLDMLRREKEQSLTFY